MRLVSASFLLWLLLLWLVWLFFFPRVHLLRCVIGSHFTETVKKSDHWYWMVDLSMNYPMEMLSLQVCQRIRGTMTEMQKSSKEKLQSLLACQLHISSQNLLWWLSRSCLSLQSKSNPVDFLSQAIMESSIGNISGLPLVLILRKNVVCFNWCVVSG